MKVRDKPRAQDLLLIAPHFRVFIKDQVSLIRSYFSNTTILIPLPYFSGFASKLPYLRRSFGFLESALESCNESGRNFTIVQSKFFTLPIEEIRKRNCFLASTSSITTLSKNAINFNLIHAHFLDNGFIGASLKNLFDKPLVVTAHGGDVYDLPFRDDWYNTLARHVLNKADQVISVSQFNATKLLSLGVSPNKLHVIPNGYDDKLFKPINPCGARGKLGLPLNKKIILSAGNLVAVKGHTHLLDAMKIVLKKHDDIILVIVGSGPLSENLRGRTRELNLEKEVLFTGQRKHEEIPVWMNACDVFVLPSLSEGFPTVIPEALACGKPVIGTKVGGTIEILKTPEIGLLTNSKDANSLAAGILKALNTDWNYRAIRRYAEQYSWRCLVPDIISVYEEALCGY